MFYDVAETAWAVWVLKQNISSLLIALRSTTLIPGSTVFM